MTATSTEPTTYELLVTEFKTPELGQTDHNKLMEALKAYLDGKTVTLAVSYHKVTNSKPSIAGKDYKKNLFLTPDKLQGEIKKIAKGKNGWYVLCDMTITRTPLDEDGKVVAEAIGWRSIKGEGIDAFTGAEWEGKDN